MASVSTPLIFQNDCALMLIAEIKNMNIATIFISGLSGERQLFVPVDFLTTDSANCLLPVEL